MQLNQEIDIAVGVFSVIQVRQSVVDFTVPFYLDSNAILIPPPTRGSQLFAFAKPFRLNVWLLLVAFIFILSFTMWMQDKVLQVNKSHLDKPTKLSSNGFLFIYGILFTQCNMRIKRNTNKS